MENIHKYLEKIAITLKNSINSNRTSMNEDLLRKSNVTIIQWITEISAPKYNLIDNMISILTDPVTTPATIHNIYYIFLKCVTFVTEISKQLLSNKQFLQSLVNYISSIDNDNKELKVSLDSIYLFIKIFSISIFETYLSEEFLNGLFETLSIINDERNLEEMVEILINISSLYIELDDNLFLKIYHYHDNARLVNEIILRLINIDDKEKEKLYPILLCTANIMDYEKCCVFYSSDLEVLIDLLINKLSSTYSDELKFFLLEVLEKVTVYDEYYKDMYKIDELNDLLEGFATNDDQSENIQAKAQTILDNIVNKI